MESKPSGPVALTAEEKPMMVVGVDKSEQSNYALEGNLDRFFAPYAFNVPFELIIVHAKPNTVSAVGLAGPGTAEVVPYVDEKAKPLCLSKSVHGAMIEVFEGDARNVLCEVVGGCWKQSDTRSLGSYLVYGCSRSCNLLLL